jgi:hypothetical protein
VKTRMSLGIHSECGDQRLQDKHRVSAHWCRQGRSPQCRLCSSHARRCRTIYLFRLHQRVEFAGGEAGMALIGEI